jgi:hypothetical protein
MTELDQLLMSVRDGDTRPATLARARALLAVDPRLPPDLREFGLSEDEPAIDAAALLGVLGLDDGLLGGLLAEALADEAAAAPRVGDITAEMLQDQEAAGLPPVAEAVRAEAGEVDIAVSVVVRMGLIPAPVADAVRSEAGEVEVVGEVVDRMRAEALVDVAGAVAALAGRVDLLDAIMARVMPAADPDTVPLSAPIADAVRTLAGEVDVVPAVSAALGHPVMPVAAAVVAEAGDAEVWSGLAAAFSPEWASALLDRELAPAAHRLAAARMRERGVSQTITAWAEIGQAVRDQVVAEAGSVAVWGAVAARIGVADAEAVAGWREGTVAEAVRAAAGTVDVTRAVESRVRARHTAMAPAAANDSRAWVRVVAVGLAAAAVLFISVSRVIPLLSPGISEDASLAVAPDFATGEEIRVEDLSWSAESHVQVIQSQDDAGQQALIIWIDEEA